MRKLLITATLALVIATGIRATPGGTHYCPYDTGRQPNDICHTS